MIRELSESIDDVAIDQFFMFSPGPLSVLKKGKWIGRGIVALSTIKMVGKISEGCDELPETIGSIVGRKIVGRALVKPISRKIKKAHIRATETQRPFFKKNGIGGRSWIGELDRGKDGRIVKKMIVVYHDAYRAGKHLDIHIGHLSLIVQVSGKPVENAIRFNRLGGLTTSSKEALMDHIREGVHNNSRMPQNIDHSIDNARISWNVGDDGLKGYGAGTTRQIVMEEDVEILDVKDGSGNRLRMYIPSLNKHGQVFLHKLYLGSRKQAPIVIFGMTRPKDPIFKDRLHLKKVEPSQSNSEFFGKVDRSTITRKWDGASAYFEIDEGGMTLWSPRISAETGRRIEYTHKVPELMRIVHPACPQGMGEMTFKRRLSRLLPIWEHLSFSEIGGIMNSNSIRPRGVKPDFKIYRMDRWDGEDVSDLPFHQNRALQATISALNDCMSLPEFIKLPKKIKKSWEGIVGVPAGKGINHGLKLKLWGDEDDWEVESVDLGFGPTGRVAGVIRFQSETSGKRFNLGPGQIGDQEECLRLMRMGSTIIGAVAKVQSRRGHEGRASVLRGWHDSKGVGL